MIYELFLTWNNRITVKAEVCKEGKTRDEQAEARWSKNFIVLNFLVLLYDTSEYLIHIWKLCLPQTFQTGYADGYEASGLHLIKEAKDVKTSASDLGLKPRSIVLPTHLNSRRQLWISMTLAYAHMGGPLHIWCWQQDCSFYFRARGKLHEKQNIIRSGTQ